MEINCPVPTQTNDKIMLAHGGGGKLSNKLIEDVLLKELDNPWLRQMHDGARLDISGPLAFTTDSYVVNPIQFPGGDIGDLSINGTVNDLTCCGAKPAYISLGLILEEGLDMAVFRTIVQSIAKAAKRAGVVVVTGDTKVVEKGKGDQMFINTSGIGEILPGINIHSRNVSKGDVIIINGGIAEHGIAILSAREGLAFETSVRSDTAPLFGLFHEVYKITRNIRVMRDPTRGGLASSLNEIARAARTGITIWEKDIPVEEEVRGACEILGFDPLYVANEGKMLFFVPANEADKVLSAMRRHPLGQKSAIIGEVTGGDPLVRLQTTVASHRIVDMISGEQLPRIC
jgi:hydrogenase expression/formation protein HypE